MSTTAAIADLAQFSAYGYKLQEFGSWFEKKTQENDCVIALARAAPRLLQYYSLIDRVDCPVFCERAIPFFPPDYFKGRRVLLFDDTINFGSTMASVRGQLLQLGAQVECAAIAIDFASFFGEPKKAGRKPSRYAAELNPDFLIRASSHELDILHGLELQALWTMGKPYMFDFPIFEIALHPSVRSCSPNYIAKLLGESSERLFIWPGTDFLSGNIRNFGIPIPVTFLERLFPLESKFVEWQRFSKIRVFIDYQNLILRFVPLIQLNTKTDEISDNHRTDVITEDRFLQSIFDSVQKS